MNIANQTEYNESMVTEVNLGELVLILWRRKAMILGFVLAGILSGFLISFILKPVYSSSALLLIQEGSDELYVEQKKALPKIETIDTAYILTQMQVLRSRTLIAEVIRELSNDQRSGKKSNDEADDHFFHLKQVNNDAELSARVTHFIESLRIKSLKGSYAVEVTYNDPNPVIAANSVNTLIKLYIEKSLDTRLKQNRKITNWLDIRLKNLREQLLNAELALENYRLAYNLIEGERNLLSAEKYTDLNQQLKDSMTEYEEAKLYLDQFDILDSPIIDANKFSVSQSRLYSELKIKKLDLESELDELSKRYGHKHPRIITKQSEINGIDKLIDKEIVKLKKSAQSKVDLAQTKLDRINDNIAEVRLQLEDNVKSMIKLRELEQEVETSRHIYKTYLENYKRAVERDDIQRPEARILSAAEVPISPYFPNKPIIIALFTLLFSFTGVVSALLSTLFKKSKPL